MVQHVDIQHWTRGRSRSQWDTVLTPDVGVSFFGPYTTYRFTLQTQTKHGFGFLFILIDFYQTHSCHSCFLFFLIYISIVTATTGKNHSLY